jgi:two-component system LytT family response regulator
MSEIIYCEASGAYANVHLCGGKITFTSRTLGDFESQLTQKNFFRIHHSFLINLNRVKEFQRNEGAYVLMESNIKLAVSQRRRKDFLDAIEKFVLWSFAGSHISHFHHRVISFDQLKISEGNLKF